MGLKYAGARAKVIQGSSSSFTEEMLFTKIYFFCALTPELSRTALRPRQWFNLSAISAAVKRSRLERFVSLLPVL